MSSIQDHYDRYPYPDARRLVYPRDPNAARRVLGWSLGPDRAVVGPLRIWVAGCGTIQATEIALRYPNATVLASDLSEQTLATARTIAKSAGVADRVRFEQHDLSTPLPSDERFDHIDSMGVVHHPPRPDLALQHLAERLAPNGVLDLMVYQVAHRARFVRLARSIKLLWPDAGIPQVIAVLEAVAAGPGVDAAERAAAAELLDQANHQPSASADTLLHPHEFGYTPRTLVDVCASAGLAFDGFAFPVHWEPARYLNDLALVERLKALAPVDGAEALTGLLGESCPYLDLRFRLASAAPPRGWTDAELMSGTLTPHGAWSFSNLQAHAVTDGGAWFPFPEEDGSIHAWGVRGEVHIEPAVAALVTCLERGCSTVEALQRWASGQGLAPDVAESAFLLAARRLLDPSVRLVLFEGAA